MNKFKPKTFSLTMPKNIFEYNLSILTLQRKSFYFNYANIYIILFELFL
jgi:hypothetical protein